MRRKDVEELEFLRVETRGRAVYDKFWVLDNGVKKLVKNSVNSDQDLMEYISSIILKETNIDVVDVELGYDALSNRKCCLITSFLEEEEASYDICDVVPVRSKTEEEEIALCFGEVFSKFDNLFKASRKNVEDLKRNYVRVLFGKCLTENSDSKLENIGLIFNEKSSIYKLPPSYDNGMSFGNYSSISDPHCCVANQYYKMEDVTTYILENFFEYVKDIPGKLDVFVETKLDDLLVGIEGQISDEKIEYIRNYLCEFKNRIKGMCEDKCI